MKAQRKVRSSSLRVFTPWRLRFLESDGLHRSPVIGLGARLLYLSPPLTLILALAGLLASCRSQAPSTAVDFFPASDSVPDWMKESATGTYDAGNLWKYIDGDADKYVQAGMVKMLTSTYRFSLVSDASIDVYVMGDAAGARKIYDSESAQGSQPLAIGDAGRYAKGLLTFRQGPYFVHLVAYEDSPEMAKALAALARAVSGKLSATPRQ